MNRYSYALGNPVRYVDPSGHAAECGIARGSCGTGVDGELVTAAYRSKQWREENQETIQTVESGVLDFIPLVGDVKGLIEVATGQDLMTGENLGLWRFAGLLGASEIRNMRHFQRLDEFVSANTIRWTQDSIQWHTKSGIDLDTLAGDIGSNGFKGTINVVEVDEKIYSLDNRRLTVAKMLDMDVSVKYLDINVPKVLDEFNRKFTTDTDGLFIRIRGSNIWIDNNGHVIE